MPSKFAVAATVYALVGVAAARSIPGTFVKRIAAEDAEGDWRRQVLDLHNQERTGCGQKALIWNDLLANSASGNSQACEFKHSSNGQRSGSGENIAEGTVGFFGADKLCQGWIDEKHGGGEDGHYTQIVWKDTTDLGCDLAVCGDNNYLVCQYWPAGNFNGDDANQVCVGGEPERSAPGEHFGGFSGNSDLGSAPAPAPGGKGTSGSSPVGGGDSPVDTGSSPVRQPTGGKPREGKNRGHKGGNKKPTPTGSKKPCPSSGSKSSPVTGKPKPSYGQPRSGDNDSRPHGGRRPHRHNRDDDEKDSRRRPAPVYGNKRVSDVDNNDNDDKEYGRRHRHGDNERDNESGHRRHRGDNDDNDDGHRRHRGDDDSRPKFGHREESDSRRGDGSRGKKPCPDEGKKHRD